uniref:RanBP-type and C3HC4-type zinc finger-containing protein 1 n=1 Tax=Heliothis virescens TaxID=7102 RepID=A0A2A4IYK3_HELVI
MNNNAELEGRPRPLSTGLWTLFSWLRRDDRSVSSDSLSSAGSDRTVASFAFLTPARYQPAKGPLILPPPGPPTDSYKKRVHDRNLRRNHDRDITLHRKYGLYKSDGTCGYDAFSLPTARKVSGDSCNRWDRDRRATSECYQRRLAHVPGKRRAPLPPVVASPTGTSSLSRRYTRKRPAPQPPVRILDKNKHVPKDVEGDSSAGQMSSQAYQDKSKIKNTDSTMGCKSEKYSKKDASTKDNKLKPEKSFLKQMFDSKKRNSYVDTSTVKILPSISELDKQAAELIETCKLKTPEQNNNVMFNKLGSQSSNQTESWFCLRCLRKYDSTVVTCAYCVSKGILNSSEIVKNNKEPVATSSNNYTQTEKGLPSNRNTDAEDKQKLKEMLKEMKDSLPKRPKHELNNKKEKPKTVETNPLNYSSETPTLRVGSTIQDDRKKSPASSSNYNLKAVPEPACSTKNTHQVSPQAALVAQVVSSYQKNVNNHLNLGIKLTTENRSVAQTKTDNILQKQAQDTKILHTPLKISSLLNPMYVPKNNDLVKQQSTNITKKESSVATSSAHIAPGPSTSQTHIHVTTVKTENQPKTSVVKNDKLRIVPTREKKVIEANAPRQIQVESPPVIREGPLPNVMDAHNNQHSRRRDLINQLEKSIAQGDERAAAEAAAKLAQLRLSCSVLSFSSQILSQASSSSTSNEEIKRVKDEKNNGTPPIVINSDTKPIQNELPEPKLVKPISAPKPSVSNERNTSCILPKGTEPIKTEISQQCAVQKKKDDIKLNEKDVKKETNKNDNLITIAVLVEDREATRGPVHLHINRLACIRDLRREAETSLGLAANLQRWIVGRVLCVNDDTPVASLAGPDFSAPFYLCVVESETKHETNAQKNNEMPRNGANDNQVKTRDVYKELVQLEQQALVPNAENFECGVCMEEYPAGQGVVLRECVHIFCRDCLSDVVRHCEEPDVPCPAMGCRGMLQEREIRALVSPQDYERWLARGLAAAESGTRNAFHCRTRDCKGWALCDPGVQRFPCPVCKCINCVPCQAIHDGETCEQHRAKLKQASSKSKHPNETDDGTRTLLNSLISKGEALECPECSAIITKKWGCDWVKCSACKTEICWVTRGRRWGPGGKGDTSAGCRCGVDGKRCHPSCGYCH